MPALLLTWTCLLALLLTWPANLPACPATCSEASPAPAVQPAETCSWLATSLQSVPMAGIHGAPLVSVPCFPYHSGRHFYIGYVLKRTYGTNRLTRRIIGQFRKAQKYFKNIFELFTM